VYILASQKNGTLYIGVTDNLIRRVFEHKQKFEKKSFTAQYKVDQLVYFEETEEVLTAIAREKQLKNWKRQWKIELVEKENPEWKDLYKDLLV
jgi:putative endonuclease